MTAEELLMSEESEAFEYSNVITIDRESRAINVPLGQEMFGVEGDKGASIKHFSCPKIVGDNIDIDLSAHNLYVNYVVADKEGNQKSEDVQQAPCDNIEVEGENITFDWKISEWVTQEDGFIAFSIVAKKSVDGILQTRWYTTPAVGHVLKTIKEGANITQKYPDVIDNLMNRVAELERVIESGGGDSQIDPRRIPDMYYKESGGVILPETDFTVDSSIDDDEMKEIEPALNLVVGEEYTVKWNDVEYKCTASSFEMEGLTGIYIGEAMGEVTGKFPFSFVNAPDMLGDNTLLLIIDDVTVTVSVTQGGSTIHTIPEEYLGLDWLPKETESQELVYDETIHLSTAKLKAFDSVPFQIVGGRDYLITWDGVEYERTAHSYTNNDYKVETYYLGNASLDDYASHDPNSLGDTGEPFLYVYCYVNDSLVWCVINGTVADTDIPFKVVEISEGPNKLPVEFLPDGVPYLINEMAEIIPETEATFEPDTEYTYPIPLSVVFEVGKTYSVVWNGVECVCTGQYYASEDAGEVRDAVVVGNGEIFGLSTNNEPFVIMYSPEVYGSDGISGVIMYYELAMNGGDTETAKFSVSGGSKQIHKLPEECLPESIDSVIIRSSTEGSTKKFKLTVDDSGTISATEIVE